MKTYPIENLLRAPVEWLSSLTCLAGAALLLWIPEFFLPMWPDMVLACSVLLVVHALYRFWQGWQIVRYKQGLRILPRYSLSGAQIPVSRENMFLGIGFYWDKRHTARMHQLQDKDNIHLLQPSRLMNCSARINLWLEQSGVPGAQRLKKMINAPSVLNPLRPMPKLGGVAATHGVGLWEGEKPIWFDLGERVGHLLVLGTTRVGKTRAAELLITQDIQRGDVVIVIDPKGDADLLRRVYIEAQRAGRLDDLYIFHLGRPDLSARYNPIDSFDRITEVATRVANQLPGEGQSAAFKQFVWRYVNVIGRTMLSLGDRINYAALYRIAGTPDPLAVRYFEKTLNEKRPGWEKEFDGPFAIAQEKKEEGLPEDDLTTALRRAVSAARSTKRNLRAIALFEYMSFCEITDDIASSLGTMLTNDRAYFDKLVSSLYPLLEKLTTGRVAELISPNYDDPNDPRPVFTWQEVVNRRGIVYVGLDALSDFEVSAVIGNAMFADLTSLAGKAYNFSFEYGQPQSGQKRPQVSIHADEFNELIGQEFIPMLNKAGGAGYQVSCYTQTLADIEARIGNRAQAEQMLGNFNSLLMLRVKTESTAKLLTDQLPEVEVVTKMIGSSTTDMGGENFETFSTRNEDRLSTQRVPMLTPSDLTKLPKGQCFALIEGGRLVKIRLPMPDASGDGDLPSDISDLVHSMRQQYLRLDDEEGEGDAVPWVELAQHGQSDPLEAAIAAVSK